MGGTEKERAGNAAEWEKKLKQGDSDMSGVAIRTPKSAER